MAESLDSWLFRLAQGNVTSLEKLIKDNLLEYSGVTSSPKLELPIGIASLHTKKHSGVYRTLSWRTATPINTVIESSLLNGQERKPLGFTNLQSLRKGYLLPLSETEYIRKGGPHRKFLTQFCPECLDEDAVQFFRSFWHLNFVAICGRHRALLQDCCPRCRRAVRFELLSWQSQIGRCYECDFELSKAEPLPLAEEDQRAQDFHRWLLDNTLRSVQDPLAESRHAISCVKMVQRELTRSFSSLHLRGLIIKHGRREHGVELKPLASTASKATVMERWVALSRLASIWSW